MKKILILIIIIIFIENINSLCHCINNRCNGVATGKTNCSYIGNHCVTPMDCADSKDSLKKGCDCVNSKCITISGQNICSNQGQSCKKKEDCFYKKKKDEL
jgi:hypothetical protein